MQFHFPQYIDIEDKIFGPLTFKQAIYVAGGAGAAYLVYRLFPSLLFISVPLMVAIAAFTWALAFYPKEKLGKPFIEILQAGLSYMLREKLYTWKKVPKELRAEEVEFIPSKNTTQIKAPSVRSKTLSSLSFGLDIKGPDSSEGKMKAGVRGDELIL
ncbi:MAG: PrgI family protein [Patescibacteria group bacterium]